MSNAKERIIETAIYLFNEKGYENVSLREIAKEAGTTIGNFTYHFKKKEDLIISIVSDLHEDYSFYFMTDLYGIDLLNDLIKSFQTAQENQIKYPFYYRNVNEIISKSNYFLQSCYDFQKRVHDYYLSCLLVLQEDKIIKQNFTLTDLGHLTLSLTNIVTGWSVTSSPYNNPRLRQVSLSDILVSLIKPYLEDEYIHIIEEIN